jgi:hypothetical protein
MNLDQFALGETLLQTCDRRAPKRWPDVLATVGITGPPRFRSSWQEAGHRHR